MPSHSRMSLLTIAQLAILALVVPAAAQQASGPVAEDELAPVHAIKERLAARLDQPLTRLDVDLIMQGPDFSGTQPRDVRWDPDGKRLWFQWKRWDESQVGTWEYDMASGSLRRLSEEQAERVPTAFAIWGRDHERALWSVRDTVMTLDGSGTRALISGLDGARPVGISANGDAAIVRYQNNLLALQIQPRPDIPPLRRLTDIRPGREQDDEPATDSQRWLRDEQLDLFDVLDRRHERREEAERRDEDLQPEPLWLQGWQVVALVASPDLRWVAITARREAPDDRVAEVPNYVTTSGYTEEISTRIKVGDEPQGSKVGVIEVATGRVAWAAVLPTERAATYTGAVWNEQSSAFLVQARADDNKDRWFAVLSTVPTDATLELASEVVADDHDDAWINWSVASGYGWLPGGERIFFVSERSGSMHLYTVAATGGDPSALTSGDFEVFAPRLAPQRDAFVFEASLTGPFEVQTYRLPLTGGEPQALTAGHGRQDSVLSPDGSHLAIVASSADSPWELYVRTALPDGQETRITHSPSPAFDSYPWVAPPIIHFTARDGVEIPARLYLPRQPNPAHSAVIFVHGAGYLHNVHRWWSSYSREYTFHHLLMERGYTVLDIDYRGSAGYGRDWRTAIYRHMGGQDLTDQVDGAAWLVSEHGIDPERIGIYGGSYGGFITLMALFTEGDHFAAGAALRPVTDWAHYNDPYTSNILNAPQEDAEAYRRSSPIYFAEGLQDPLLICHGVVDTNVHFQGVVRLAQRLIELHKDNWEVALYPVESHGFVESASWADEYRRILRLFESNLE